MLPLVKKWGKAPHLEPVDAGRWNRQLAAETHRRTSPYPLYGCCFAATHQPNQKCSDNFGSFIAATL